MLDLCAFFLDIKQRDTVKFLVHTDDVLFLCKTKKDLQMLYIDFVNHLYALDLQPNLAKVQEGRFANGVLDYCGYRFAGGYVTISPAKIETFKIGIANYCTHYLKKNKLFSERAFIKNINRKINGFGHYYKCGSVANLFEKLDSYIRSQIRLVYKRLPLPLPSNTYLETLGLRSLTKLKKEKKTSLITTKMYQKKHTQPHLKETNLLYIGFLEHLVHQNTEIIHQLKALNKNTIELQKILHL